MNKVQQEKTLMTEIAYEKALAALRNGKQVMVFVHARNETVRFAVAARTVESGVQLPPTPPLTPLLPR